MLKRLLYKDQDYDSLQRVRSPSYMWARCFAHMWKTIGWPHHVYKNYFTYDICIDYIFELFKRCGTYCVFSSCKTFTVHYCLPILFISLLLFFTTHVFHLGVSPTKSLKIIIIQLSALYFWVRINLHIYLVNDIHI